MFAVEGSRHKEFYNCQMLLRTDIQTRVASYDYLLVFNWCDRTLTLLLGDKDKEAKSKTNICAPLELFMFTKRFK